MEITICQRLMKLFLPTWQHHRLMIASTIVAIIQSLTNGVEQFGKANPRLGASLLQCTLRRARCTGGIRCPDRLQWLRDRLTHDHALIGGFIVAFLLAALMWFLWIAPGISGHGRSA
jgi:hypothetical protein